MALYTMAGSTRQIATRGADRTRVSISPWTIISTPSSGNKAKSGGKRVVHVIRVSHAIVGRTRATLTVRIHRAKGAVAPGSKAESSCIPVVWSVTRC